jgi:phospholipase C
MPIKHVIVIMQENRSFDNLFHGFPGANTVDFGWSGGKKYTLQPVTLKWPYDLRHDHPQFLEDYSSGTLRGFANQITGFKKGAGCSDYLNHPSCWIVSGKDMWKQMPFSYVKQSDVQPYWTIAQDYALGDNAFASNNGPSYPSHQYMIAAQSGHATEVPDGQPWGCNAPPSVTVELLAYGQADPPEFSKATGHEVPGPFPCFTYTTMADLLDQAGVTWRFYASSLTNSGGNLSAYMAISQIYNGPDYKNDVIHPDTKILDDIKNGQLRQVSWVTPTGSKSDHGGNDSGNGGPDWVASIVNAVGASSYWNDTAIIVMWDEWGGWYDHVKPHQYKDPVTGAFEGLGFRVPLLVVSPYVKPGYISHNEHEIASTVKFIEEVFGLPTLGLADERAGSLDDMFNFSQKRLKFKAIPAKRDARWFLTHPDNTPGDDY